MSKLPPKRPGVPASPSKVVYRQPRSSSINQQRNSISGLFKIGDRVTSGEKTGTVAFIGPTKFAEGSNGKARHFSCMEILFLIN